MASKSRPAQAPGPTTHRPLIPAGLAWWREFHDGAAWLNRLPQLVDECAALWSLEIGAPYEPASVALVLRAERGGVPCVLKINFPEDENRDEGRALSLWNGDGAVRLLAENDERRALLLERVDARAGDDSVVLDVLPRLWRPVSEGFIEIEDVAARWSRTIPDAWRR